jgi:hypothetical protein
VFVFVWVKVKCQGMKSKKIVFKTKDGREVSFKKKPGVVKVKKENQMKTMEKRLMAMEKAVMKYNKAAVKRNEKVEKVKKEKVKSVKKAQVVEVDSDSD